MAFSTGADWSFEQLPGGWEKAQTAPSPPDAPSPPPPEESKEFQEAHASSAGPVPPRRRRAHYPPRQCRICLDVVHAKFEPDAATAIPAPLQSAPRVVYESEDGGRLLSPCYCKGSQKYVHEDCLSSWRRADPMQKRNYWQCPTCHYKYRLQRLTWASWLSSTFSQIGLTFSIFMTCVFILGFVADPIINLYLDPLTTITTAGGPTGSLLYEDEPTTWVEHFGKGMASLGLLGFAKFIFTLSPLQWFNMRGSNIVIGRSNAAGSGRDRLSQVSWIAVLVGIATFLLAVWKGVRAWSRKTLEHASERVLDVRHDNDDDGDADTEYFYDDDTPTGDS